MGWKNSSLGEGGRERYGQYNDEVNYGLDDRLLEGNHRMTKSGLVRNKNTSFVIGRDEREREFHDEST